MTAGAAARRLVMRARPRSARRAWLALCLGLGCLAGGLAGAAWATPPDIVVAAEFSEPTTRYGHAVLGDGGEWGAMVLTVDPCLGCEGSIPYEVVIQLRKTGCLRI